MRKMTKYTLPVLAFLAVFAVSAAAFAKNYDVQVSVDGKGHVTVVPDPVPSSGALEANDHVHWSSNPDCHLDLTILDSDAQGKWPKPNDHNHSNQADVDTPKKSLGQNKNYKYSVTISCDSGGSGTADPELVVAGGTKHHPGHRAMEGETKSSSQAQPSAVQILVDSNAGAVDNQSATVRKDQVVHWHARNGKIVHIQFDDPQVNVPCSSGVDCGRGVSDLQAGKTYHYVIDVTDDSGHNKRIDPELVIAGGPFRPPHSRLKKQ